MKHVLTSLVFLLLTMIAQAGDQTVINICAEGKASAKPDIAKISLSLFSSDLEASSANRLVDKDIKKLLNKLSKYEIREGSLDTSHASIQAEYDYNVRPKKLLGYRATRQIHFDLVALKQLDELVEDLSKLKHVNLNNLNFAVKDTQYLEDFALINAIQLAKQKAELIANEFGRELDKLLSLSHQTNQSQPPMHARAMSLEMDRQASTYEQKDIEVKAYIDVKFSLK